VKRSEMLKKLYQDVDIFLSLEGSPFNDENLVDFILDKVEEYGMKPPDTGNGFKEGNYWEKE
jgi:hypothetical protein